VMANFEDYLTDSLKETIQEFCEALMELKYEDFPDLNAAYKASDHTIVCWFANEREIA